MFCGGTKLSNEHIFAQWLLKELSIFEENVAMTHVSILGDPLSKRKHSFSRLVNGLVCETCNNGWMSQLEGECQPHITKLMNMKTLKPEMDYLEKDHETIAKWAFKNAILLNSATNYRQLVPNEHYICLYTGSIPKGVFIDLAFCQSDTSLEWLQSPGRLVVKEQGIDYDMDYDPYKNRYTITFQIKHLLIKVSFYESKYNTYYDDEGAICLFPQFGKYGTLKLFDDIASFDVHGVFHEYNEKKD